MSIFVSCQEKANSCYSTIGKFNRFKILWVYKDSETLNSLQKQNLDTQNQNLQVIEKQFNVFRTTIHEMRNCDNFLYPRQVTFTFDIISSLLSLTYSNVKSYRSALFAFQMFIMTSIPFLLSQYLPMSLIPKDSLEIILQMLQPSNFMDKLALAFSMDELLAFYEARLLLGV